MFDRTQIPGHKFFEPAFLDSKLWADDDSDYNENGILFVQQIGDIIKIEVMSTAVTEVQPIIYDDDQPHQ